MPEAVRAPRSRGRAPAGDAAELNEQLPLRRPGDRSFSQVWRPCPRPRRPVRAARERASHRSTRRRMRGGQDGVSLMPSPTSGTRWPAASSCLPAAAFPCRSRPANGGGCQPERQPPRRGVVAAQQNRRGPDVTVLGRRFYFRKQNVRHQRYRAVDDSRCHPRFLGLDPRGKHG